MRTCTKCLQQKDETEFYSKSGGRGLHACCKPCHCSQTIARGRALRSADPEGFRAKRRAQVATHKRQVLATIQCLNCGIDVPVSYLSEVERKKFCSKSCASQWHGSRRMETIAALQIGGTRPDAALKRKAASAAANADPAVRARRSAGVRAYYADPEARAAKAAQLRGLQENDEVQRRRLANLKRGADHPAYRDGSGSKQRPRALMRQWRTAIFERDDYTCQGCGQRGGELQADHIKAYSEFPDLRWDVGNGRTLCVPCHRETPTYGRKQAKRLQTIQCEGVAL